MKQNDCIKDEPLLWLTAWASRAMIADLNRRFHEAGLRVTMEQWRALAHLCDREGLTQNDLAGLLLQEKTSVSRLLTGMQRRGYITRDVHARDGRCNCLRITDTGREVCRKGRALAGLTISAAGEAVSQDDQDACRRVLHQIIHNLRGLPQAQAQTQPQAQAHDTADCVQA